MIRVLWALAIMLCSVLAVEPDIYLRTINILSLPFQIVPLKNPDISVYEQVNVVHDGFIYTSTIYLGSNNQQILVQVDTGSSDLSVPAPNVKCVRNAACTEGGTFNSSSSSTFKDLNAHYELRYLDGTSSRGDYGTDSLSFQSDGLYGVKDLQFGIANESANYLPVLGIGFKSLEVTGNSTPKYDNLPISLKNQGYINKVAYLVFLNDLNAKTGHILFGAYDRAKIEGDLVPLPITASDRLNVDLNSITYNGQDIDINFSVTLDTGASVITLLPKSFEALGKALNGTQKTDRFYGKHYIFDCDAFNGQSLLFNFDGVSIAVPFDDLLKQNSDGSCTLLILEGEHISSLGDNFLRHAYLLYDLEDRTISMSKVKFTKDSEIVPVY